MTRRPEPLNAWQPGLQRYLVRGTLQLAHECICECCGHMTDEQWRPERIMVHVFATDEEDAERRVPSLWLRKNRHMCAHDAEWDYLDAPPPRVELDDIGEDVKMQNIGAPVLFALPGSLDHPQCLCAFAQQPG